MGGDDGALGSKARTWRACTSEGTRRSHVAEGVGDRNLGGGETVGVACAQAWRSGRVDNGGRGLLASWAGETWRKKPARGTHRPVKQKGAAPNGFVARSM